MIAKLNSIDAGQEPGYPESMWRGFLRRYLYPAANEKDPGFRYEIESSGRQGLRIIGIVQIVASLVMLGARFVTEPSAASLTLRAKQAGLVVALGIVNLVVARSRWLTAWYRTIAVLSGIAAAGVLIWASFLAAAQSTSPNDFIPGEITLVLLFSVTILPLRPSHTLFLGLGILLEYVAMAMIAEQTLLEGLGPDPNYVIFIVMLALLSVGVTAVVYEKRWANYEVLQQTIEAAEALRQAQNRILLTENASSLSHLTAAICHEMNNPLGALLSGMDTLLHLAQRYATAGPEEKAKLADVQSEVRRSVQQSAERVKELVGKLRRFTDVDETSMQSADVNEILRTVAAIAAEEVRDGANVDLRLETVPHVMCRPQQLSAVFRSLLSNAINAVNGDGRISILTRHEDEQVVVDIEDNGRGMTSDQIKNIFEPDFRVAGGRVAAGNWSMFNSRQIIREYGGDIRIASQQGRGTRVTIVLPATQ